MIKIKQSKSADTRSAENLVDHDTLYESSLQHIGDVQKAMNWMSKKIQWLAQKHDYTKLISSGFFFNDFQKAQKDKSIDFRILGWYKLHITKERHHLDTGCPEDVNLFDVMERIADIVMAGMARTGKVYDDNLPPELFVKAYKNTIELLKNQVQVEKDEDSK